MKRYILNDRIRCKEVRLIDLDGTQLGVLSIEQAREKASEREHDLLLVSQQSTPPVCKLVDIGQYKYEQRKREKNARKGSKAQVIKELKLSLKISEHDFDVRLNQCKKFLDKSYSVKIGVFFKGRENARQEKGYTMLQRFVEEVGELGEVTSQIMSGPRSVYVIIGPTKKERLKKHEEV